MAFIWYDENLLAAITEALMEGRGTDFAESLANFLRFSVSFYDTANRESFYHGLMLGLLATLMPRFEVLSNREAGFGRFDIAIPIGEVAFLMTFSDICSSMKSYY